MYSGFPDLLFLDKPKYETSRRAVARLIREMGFPKHTKWGFVGTLDRLASGLLPVCIEQNTRMIPYLESLLGEKTYVTGIVLGQERQGDDVTGGVISTYTPLSCSRLRTIAVDVSGMEDFFSDVQYQVPPDHSAKHVQGHRAYDLARQGKELFLPSCPVSVEATHLRTRIVNVSIRTWWKFTVSKGGYIRSLARMMGMDTGMGGFVRYLRRVGMGPIRVEDLVFRTTASGLRVASMPWCDCLASISQTALAPWALEILTGRMEEVTLSPSDIVFPRFFPKCAYAFGYMSHKDTSYVVVGEISSELGSLSGTLRYKIRKRIEVLDKKEGKFAILRDGFGWGGKKDGTLKSRESRDCGLLCTS